MQFALLVLLLVASVSSYFQCTDDSLLRDLPRRLRSATITVATSANAAPFVTRSSYGVPYGFDIDLMNLISYLYQIKFQYQYVPFASLITTVQSNVNTISISSQTITLERMKSVDFAQFFKTGTAFIVRSSYGQTITGLGSLCGKTVSVVSATTQYQDVTTQNTMCGANIINIKQFATLAIAINAVSTGAADVAVSDEAALIIAALESNNTLKVVGTPYNVQPYGILCNKMNPELCCALVNAINYLIEEGIYEQLLQRYSFTYANNGVCPSRINLVGSTCSRKCTPTTGQCNRYLG
ncbi:unnamed protein product [Rotaria sp. Silwood2]|nr:unnamed protein product [Rotaria sp. Silwood2]CAF3181899.1 unnamed protein product [Rotaria sp. Silwood2]CAF4402829.1 unnamed protein product [Rotaria sp. Silwood2]CAF4550295.1 unnamed protein product [Rotaria sp. Silwood2]